MELSSALTIEIKPRIAASSTCHGCGAVVTAAEVLWQGIHICGRYRCGDCGQEFVEDLPVGHATATPFRITKDGDLIGADSARMWFGEPLQRSLCNPVEDETVDLTVRIHRGFRHIVILNCIDFLYGHCLLKLLNAEEHLGNKTRGLVVIVPALLRWMVPDGVAEIWEVDVPLTKAQSYFPKLHQRICQELARFDSVVLSCARSHPRSFNIQNYTRVAPHALGSPTYRITFVWRSDRLWLRSSLPIRILRRVGLGGALRVWQKRKVCRLFSSLRRSLPLASYTVAGLGHECVFPHWIDDQRVSFFTEEAERRLCEIYAESRIAIGVHGSNMLLPSAEAGMCVDLMPVDRWKNIAQDILYCQAESASDLRMAAYRVRYVPLEMDPKWLKTVIMSMHRHLEDAERDFR